MMRTGSFRVGTVRRLVEQLGDLVEVLDTPVPYSWSEKRDSFCAARFKVGEVPYLCEFGVYGHGGKWNTAFYVDKELSPEVKAKFKNKDAAGVTGTGNAGAVLSTVVAITREFIEFAHPTQITFSARGSSRVSLYEAMMRRLTQGTGWTYRKAGIGLFHLLAPAKAKTLTTEDDDEGDVDERRKKMRGRSLAAVGGHPTRVTVYRAVLKAAPRVLKPMDFVTMSFRFARGHANHNAGVEDEASPVLAASVPSKDVYEAPNPGELFYDGPQVPARIAYTAKPYSEGGA